LVLHSSGPVMRSFFPITAALARVFSAGSSPSKARVAACSLELGRAGGARERNDVADVLHAGHVHEQALEAEAEAGVGDGAEASEIEVPGVGGFGEAVRSDLFPEHVEALLALTAADALADARREHVHRAHGAPVVVVAHVKGFDLFRVVRDDDGTANLLLGEIALVLALQIGAEVDGKLPGPVRALEQADRLRVRDVLEGGA